MEEAKSGIDALLKEDRYFSPPPEFAKFANVQDADIYEKAEADFEGFWANWAEELSWFRKWEQVLNWEPPFAQWFTGGKINVSYKIDAMFPYIA